MQKNSVTVPSQPLKSKSFWTICAISQRHNMLIQRQALSEATKTVTSPPSQWLLLFTVTSLAQSWLTSTNPSCQLSRFCSFTVASTCPLPDSTLQRFPPRLPHLWPHPCMWAGNFAPFACQFAPGRFLGDATCTCDFLHLTFDFLGACCCPSPAPPPFRPFVTIIPSLPPFSSAFTPGISSPPFHWSPPTDSRSVAG